MINSNLIYKLLRASKDNGFFKGITRGEQNIKNLSSIKFNCLCLKLISINQKINMLRKKIINWFIPPRCLQCGDTILEAHQLCADCWKKIDFITKPFCFICGYPLTLENQFDICESCSHKKPIYECARSIFIYKTEGKKLILRFKHADTTELAPLFAQMLFHQAQDYFKDIDYMIPVPLHWTRLFKRRYNQAALLCLCLKKVEPNLPYYAPYFLRRVKRTESQGRKTAEKRKLNLESAFIVPIRYQKNLQGKTILLIDDVMTSGATAEECSRVLYTAGCASVKVLTIAKVLLNSDPNIAFDKDDE